MSARLERVREAFAALNDGEHDAAAEYMTEDVELRPPAHPEKPIRGSDAVVDWLRPDSFDRQRYEIRELRENEDRVFIELEFVGRGRASGIELRQPAWVVYEYEGELVRRMTAYPDRVAAREAAGLPG